MINMQKTTKHIDIVAPRVVLENQRVGDIGAGNGDFSRDLAAHGARVLAVEIDQSKVDLAKNEPNDNIDFMVGGGENIPVADSSMDIVFFVFSLHHVPLDLHTDVMLESLRVLRRDGSMIVIDPKPYGDMSEVIQPVEDETHVRTITQHRLDSLESQGAFALNDSFDYIQIRRYKSVDEIIEQVVMVDPKRRARLAQAREELTRRFHRLGRSEGEHFTFYQPVAYYHFTKCSSG